MKTFIYSCLVFVLIAASCSEDLPTEQKVDQTTFNLLDSTRSGIDFVNRVVESNEFNGLTYRNFYNGGGVAIGDINNDGLPDVFFTSNLEENQLYLNRGDLHFENISASAGVEGDKAWSTGASMADVNGDGLLDIYVSNSGDVAGDNKQNELYINNGDLTFTEAAAEFGLNDEGYSTQGVFFDYDSDGDLDCYLLNNSFKDPSKIELYRSMRDEVDPLGGDKLFRNDRGKFVNVSQEAGIYSSEIGFGLGASIGDLNGDLLPDLYVSNDFWERDYLYINKGDGTFSEELIDRIDYCSISSMGGDIADINNDGYPEVVSTDMLAADNYRLKAMSAFDPYHLENIKYRANYHYQIAQNCLHLNSGDGFFQEVAMLSGVAATDWSWGALFFDFDNDGYKDLFISNGLQRDLMYLDFRDYMTQSGVYQMMAKGEPIDYVNLSKQMPSTPLSNYAFLNSGGIQFSNATSSLGLQKPSFSNGSAYADLDLDGDLDLVINNVNDAAHIYINQANLTANNYLKIKFSGPEWNAFGIGCKAIIDLGEEKLVYENYASRGFQSSVEQELTIGVGETKTIVSVQVIWPGGKSEIKKNVSSNGAVEFDFEQAEEGVPPQDSRSPLFALQEQALVGGKHNENTFSDFDYEALQLGMISTQGPKIVGGDVNGDKLDDFILLGAFDDEDKLFIQKEGGDFSLSDQPAFRLTRAFESTCGELLDFDGDGDLDLMLGSGGNEPSRDGQLYTLRYYANDGSGTFNLDNRKIPQVVGNFSSIKAADYDGDGDPDLFLGARVVPGNYGLPPRSYLLRNDNGNLRDMTPSALAGSGMITDAIWSDVDQDEDMDLLVVGEWMGIILFRNEEGEMIFDTELPGSKGWWNTIESADLDDDGDLDYVVGNWGLNSKFQIAPRKPLSMYVNDFDGNGKTEFIINWYPPLENRAYPFASAQELKAQLPGLRKQILSHDAYASETYETLFSDAIRERSLRSTANTLESSVLWNEGGKLFREALPDLAQLSPVYAIAIDDFNNDGFQDIFLGGNMYDLKPQVGRQDANKATVMLGRGGHHFEYLSQDEGGLYIEGQIRDAALIGQGNEKYLVLARNNDEALLLKRQ